ncbi:MAG: PEGA domain-containing protein [Ignavibacteriales bacterium]|nr:MAG: PEGA domain-containing protein [Ignavibacteriales bacterium]
MKLFIINSLLTIALLNFAGITNLFSQECFSQVTISTNSAGSIIILNDSLVGKGNVNLKLEKGEYNLRIKEDVFRWNQEIFDTAFTISNCNEIKKISYNFKTRDLAATFPSTIKKFKNGNNNNSFLNSTLFKALIGTAVIFGGTSAYYKHLADENFDEYNLSGNKSYLDKTHKYDLISGLAFGALQINFGILIYYFLTE